MSGRSHGRTHPHNIPKRSTFLRTCIHCFLTLVIVVDVAVIYFSTASSSSEYQASYISAISLAFEFPSTTTPTIATTQRSVAVVKLPPSDFREEMDLVYLWLDGSDPVWQKDYQATETSRSRSNDELFFSIYSWTQSAKWHRGSEYFVERGVAIGCVLWA
jgi:hypothetical protein